MCIDHEWTPFSALRAIFSSAKKPKSKSQDGKVFKRITGRLCQTIQDKEITFTNPTLWCQPHKMSFSSAIIEHWADYCAGVISSALSLLTFKVSRLRVPSPFFYFCPCSHVACWPTPSPRRQSEHFLPKSRPFEEFFVTILLHSANTAATASQTQMCRPQPWRPYWQDTVATCECDQ